MDEENIITMPVVLVDDNEDKKSGLATKNVGKKPVIGWFDDCESCSYTVGNEEAVLSQE